MASANNWRRHSCKKISSGDSVLAGLGVQFRELHPAAALLAILRLVLIGGEAFHGQPQIGAEPGLRRVEALEEIALQGGGEEALREVLGGFVVLAEFEADEFVDGLPVERRDALHRQRLAGGSFDQRHLGGRETVAVAADRGVRIAPHRS